MDRIFIVKINNYDDHGDELVYEDRVEIAIENMLDGYINGYKVDYYSVEVNEIQTHS